jgi:hypothetical protein
MRAVTRLNMPYEASWPRVSVPTAARERPEFLRSRPFLHNFLIRTQPEQHRVEMTREILRSHRTLGANTAIPWINGAMGQVSHMKEFLQKEKLHIRIDTPWRADGSTISKYLSNEIRAQTELPSYFSLG